MTLGTGSLLLGAGDTGYNLQRSLRFRASASAYLNRTPASAGNRRTYTWSGWVKRGKLGSAQGLFEAVNTSTIITSLYFNSSDQLVLQMYQDPSYNSLWTSNAVFRDPSAWYHVLFAIDTTQATNASMLKLYVNGVLQTTPYVIAQYNAIPQNYDTVINFTTAHAIGRYQGGNYFDGYLADTYFVDGQALTPASFGETNALTGVWQPKAYTGTYGTNGFYLPFTDNSALTTSSNVGLGKDFSGNGNYWATNNISITSGVTYDSMTDVPTLTSATAANFPVLNVLQNTYGLQNANMKVASNNPNTFMLATMTLPLTGKFYYEFTCDNTGGANRRDSVGIGDYTQPLGYILSSNNYVNYLGFSGAVYATSSGTVQATYATWDFGDVVNVAIDCATGKVWFGKNGTFNGSPSAGTGQAYTLINNGNLAFMVANQATTSSYNISGTLNSGQQPFRDTPPTGFVALNAYNLPTGTVLKGNTVMDATLYTGNGSTQTITNAAGFKPDLVWVKQRNGTFANYVFDSNRGVTKRIVTNTTAIEDMASGVTSFNSNGFTLGSDTGENNSGSTFVGWQWQAGQGTTSTNTSGSITSTVSVNASAGFSIVTYTGTGANATVGHGLGVAPSLIIIKDRNTAGRDWAVWHSSFSGTQYVLLNSTSAIGTNGTVWNSTTPTSSVFSIGTNALTNGSTETYVAYCWSEIAGFSKFSTFIGNGSSDGTFVYCGFRPKYILSKRTDSTGGDWAVLDSARDTYNLATSTLYPDLSNAENTGVQIDIVSNGFKCRNTGNNTSGATYLYYAFAENPFRYSLAR